MGRYGRTYAKGAGYLFGPLFQIGGMGQMLGATHDGRILELLAIFMHGTVI